MYFCFFWSSIVVYCLLLSWFWCCCRTIPLVLLFWWWCYVAVRQLWCVCVFAALSSCYTILCWALTCLHVALTYHIHTWWSLLPILFSRFKELLLFLSPYLEEAIWVLSIHSISMSQVKCFYLYCNYMKKV